MAKKLVLALTLLTAGHLPAALVSLGDPTQLTASDRLLWDTAAGNYDLLRGSFSATSELGSPVVVAQQGGAFMRLDQSAGWFGNFLPGEALLWTYYGGPIQLDFGPLGLTSIGLQVQPDLYGEYSAQLDVFDAAGRLVASTSGEGVSNPLGDGSALFLGLQGDTSFHQARIQLTGGPTLDSFAVGGIQFSAFNAPGVPSAPLFGEITMPVQANSPVPEPATFALAAFTAGCLLLARRKLT